jgi:hypothetical protein
MMVARHEMPGKRSDMIRPVGNGVICGAMLCPPCETIAPARQPIIPYPSGRASAWHIPGISYLATIIWSRRDKG